MGFDEYFQSNLEKKHFAKPLNGKIAPSLDKNKRWQIDIDDFKNPEKGPKPDEIYFVKAGLFQTFLENF